jgi:[CysO sulfur-carrier protein]-S-L-cysteine hydrolase
MHSLKLTKEQYQRMADHVQAHAPLEACGLLAGKDARVERVIEVRNRAWSTVRYIMDPVEQWNAFQWIESHGLGLVGIFHSHPNGPAVPSPTDIAETAYAVVHVILVHTEGMWHGRGFWLENGAYKEVTLLVE